MPEGKQHKREKKAGQVGEVQGNGDTVLTSMVSGGLSTLKKIKIGGISTKRILIDSAWKYLASTMETDITMKSGKIHQV